MTAFDLDLRGRRVLVVGAAADARHVLSRLHLAGAQLFLVEPTGAGDDAHWYEPPAEVRRLPQPAATIGWHDMISAVDLVVTVGVGRLASRIGRAARGTRAWLTQEEPARVASRGHVVLVGGGPGMEGSITVAGRAALARADVVYFDRLAPHDRLAEWAPGARLVDVGKTPGHHAVPQGEIEAMMVASALEGREVVRLKGGDPFVFGRGAEEVAACRAAGVTSSVISGVTSAIAVPAAAGIPVTHREVSRLFTVVSGHAPLDDETLGHLVGLGGTLVVLMGVNTLPHLTAGLARLGMDGDMPLAIVERGGTASQRTTIASVSTATERALRSGVRSPAVVVIGEVVLLSHDDDADILRDAVSLAGG